MDEEVSSCAVRLSERVDNLDGPRMTVARRRAARASYMK